MIVYSSNFKLRPEGGIDAIAEEIARWLGIKTKCFVQPNRIMTGLDEHLRDGSRVESQSTIATPQEFPLLLSVKYSHAGDVPGRQWSTEIGIKQDLPDAPFQFSILLQTHEISARVTAPIQPTRPHIVEELVRNCSAVPSTPSIRARSLDENNAKAFLQSLEHSSREVPWIIISPTRDGKYLVNGKRLRSLMLGIAEVFEIPAKTDTFDIQDIIGSKYAAWLGAVNIIFPSRKTQGKAFYDSFKLVSEQLQSIADEGRTAEGEIFSIVTHRTNLPNSWRHISPAAVANAKLRAQLHTSIKKAQTSTEAAEYAELLIEADKELKVKGEELSALRLEYEGKEEEVLQKEDEISRLESDISGLKHALSSRKPSNDLGGHTENLESLRSAVLAATNNEIGLEQALYLISVLFPERVIITESALSSAAASHSFQYGSKAFELLKKLVTTYWEDLSAGRADSEARKIFGNSYAAKESESLSNEGRRRRTFVIDGQPIEMLRHLKIGVKDSAAQTLRVHFEWISPSKKIAIGHCGAHLDF